MFCRGRKKQRKGDTFCPQLVSEQIKSIFVLISIILLVIETIDLSLASVRSTAQNKLKLKRFYSPYLLARLARLSDACGLW